MKKVLYFAVLVIVLAALAVSMAACAGGDVYGDLEKEGYTVRIKYDAGGAVVNETQNVTIVEVFNENDIVTVNGKSGIKLLSPEDSRRGDAVFKLAKTDGTNNYFCPGWYTTRTPRVDESGQPLDAYGVPTAKSGREQGYIYSGRWDFEKDLVDPASLTDGEMTLYAAWIPFYTYEIYAENESGEFELISSVKKLDFVFPEWNERTGKLSMHDMPKVKGKTFIAAYTGEAMDGYEALQTIDGDGSFVDLEKGIATLSTVKIYTRWLEGEWLKVFDAEMLVEELEDDTDGYFILGADLDFSEVEWPAELLESEFNGRIVGDGFVMKNITVAGIGEITSPDMLFGTVGENAVLDVEVE